jgi:multiple sugar transport system substrate-binding protein
MATTMESLITVLVLVAIITSAGTLYYSLTVADSIGTITSSVADLADSVADLAISVSDLATATAEDLADIADDIEEIADRVTEVEATLTPTITVVGPWSGAEMDAFLPTLARFEALSGINVRYRVLRAEDLATILPAQFAAGTAPGDVIFMWGWFIAQEGQNGHIMDVTNIIDESDFLDGTFDPVKVGNAIYGGAYTGKTKPGFWYKKSFFAKHGLTPTTANSTWEEFTTLLADIAAVQGIEDPIVSGDGVGWPLTDIADHFLITFGGAQLQKDLIAGTASWTTGPVRDVFEDYLVPTLGNFSDPLTWDSTAITSWWNEEYGLYFMGSWITGMVENATDLGIIPLPGADTYVFVGDYFFMPEYTQYPEEAQELFEFLSSEEAQRLQVAQGGHIATNVNVPLTSYPAVDRMVIESISGAGTALDLDDTVGGEFQSTLFDQLKLLWVDPTQLDDVLAAIEAEAP